VCCRAWPGLLVFTGDDMCVGEPMELRQLDTEDLSGSDMMESSLWLVCVSCSSSSTLYELFVATDVAMESAIVVSKSVDEKFGSPHWQHIQLVLCVPWKTDKGMFIHFT